MTKRRILTACIVLFAAASLDFRAAAQPATYAGRPFVPIAQANTSDPLAGFISGFGRAQIVGDSVVFVPLSGPNASGVFRGRGGPLTKLAAPGTTAPDGTLLFFHDGFARDTTTGAQVAIAAGSSRADALYRTDGTDFSVLLPSGSLLPNSGGKAANVLGEPFLVGNALAVIAAHQPGGVETFRGVYRVKAGALEAVADIATELPGGFGIPDGFSSQVGFDGASLAFWATKGPFTESEGMFMQSAAGTLTKIAQNGDAFPGGGTIDGFISPPFVAGGMVYFYAYDTAGMTRLLKFESNVLTVLAKDGDAAPDGGQLQNLGQFGLVVEGGKVFFPALTAKGAGLYVLEGGSLQTIVPAGVVVGGMLPTSIVLQDVAADTVVIEAATAANRRLVANLASPAVPVILASPTNRTVAAGARVELKVSAIGDAPLTYVWSGPLGIIAGATTDTLVIASAGATDVGNYRVTVSNAAGTVFSASALLNVEIKPEITVAPKDTTVEIADQLMLRVTAFGGLPLGYFWKKDGSPVASDSAALGIFLRSAVTAADAGRYTVVVSNAFGQATSAEAVVTVVPTAPNPVFGGGRFIAIMDSNTTAPGTETKFATATQGELSARWLGSRVAFIGQAAGSQPLGVFAWENGALTRLLAPGAALANGLGTAEDFTLVSAPAAEPLVVRAQQRLQGFFQPVGLYRFAAPDLAVIADTTLAVPEGGGPKFPAFFNDAIHAGGKTLFHAQLGNSPALYLADSTGLKRVLTTTQNLPVVGTAATFLQSLGYDGQDYVVVAVTPGQEKIAVLRVDAAGTVTSLLAKGDPLPGTASTVAAFGGSKIVDGTVYLQAFDSTFARHVLAWRDGTLTRVAGPGMVVNGLGTMQLIESSYTPAGNGRTYLTARVTTPSGSQTGLVAAGPGGIEPVLFVTKLDARRLVSAYVADADGDRVLVLVIFQDGTRALYANVGAVDGEPLRLEFTRPNATTLRFTVPDGAQLEAAATVNGSWETVTGTGQVDVTLTGDARFFRLRR